MGPILTNILKYGRLIVQLGPIIYEGIVWGKKIYMEIRKKRPDKPKNVLFGESVKRGAKYSRREIKKISTLKT